MPFKKECKALDRAGFLQIYSCLCTGSMGFPSQWFVFHAMSDWNRKQRFGTVARFDDAASAGIVEVQEIGFGMTGRPENRLGYCRSQTASAWTCGDQVVPGYMK